MNIFSFSVNVASIQHFLVFLLSFREVKKEVKSLLHSERETKRELANQMLWARQHQERVQHVKNAIVSAVHK